MMLRPDAFEAALAKPQSPLARVIWVSSDEDLLRLEACDQVRQAARNRGHRERVVASVERGFKLESALAQTRTVSLFAERTLLELRVSGKPPKEFTEALAERASTLSDELCLLVASPRLDRAATESNWCKKLLQHAWMVALPAVDRARLPAWIGERLAHQAQRADPETLQWMAQRVEGNLLAADQEVRKLALLLPPGHLAAAAVHAAVLDVARWDVFDLIDAALAGDASRVLRCLEGLRAEGTAAPVVLWALTEAVRTLLKLAHVQSAGQSLAQALREARVWGERERLYNQALRRLPAPRLRRLLLGCAQADRLSKGLDHGNPDATLKAIALTLAGAPVLTA